MYRLLPLCIGRKTRGAFFVCFVAGGFVLWLLGRHLSGSRFVQFSGG